jgi:hypothetical protein
VHGLGISGQNNKVDIQAELEIEPNQIGAMKVFVFILYFVFISHPHNTFVFSLVLIPLSHMHLPMSNIYLRRTIKTVTHYNTTTID